MKRLAVMGLVALFVFSGVNLYGQSDSHDSALPCSSAASATYSYPLEAGHELSGTFNSSNLTSAPTPYWTVTNYSGSSYSWTNYTSEGLECTFQGGLRNVYVTSSGFWATVRTTFNYTKSSDDQTIYLRILWTGTTTGANSALLELQFMTMATKVIMTETPAGEGASTVFSESLLVENLAEDFSAIGKYDVAATMTVDGVLSLSINGVPLTIDTEHDFGTPGYHRVYYMSGSGTWTWDNGVLLVSKIEGGDDCSYTFHDHLSLSAVPWGHTAMFTPQIHADYMRSEMVDVLVQLAQDYDFRGSLDVFMYGNDVYGEGVMENISLLNSLLDLQSEGWSLGVHGGGYPVDTMTAGLLTALQDFEDVFACSPAEWTDHSQVLQNMIHDGNILASDYYIGDYIDSNGLTVWVNNETEVVSDWWNLNYDSVFYENESDEFDGLLMNMESSGDISSYRHSVSWLPQWGAYCPYGWFASRSEIIDHDYLDLYCYVVASNATKISAFSWPQYGIYGDSDYYLYPQTYWQNGESWYAIDALEQLVEVLSANDAWYGNVPEMLSRHAVLDEVTLGEDNSSVTLTNPTDTGIDGVTIWTRDWGIDFALLSPNGTYYFPTTQLVGGCFAIDYLPRLSSLELSKVPIPSFAPDYRPESVNCTAYGTASSLRLHALSGGTVSLNSTYAFDGVNGNQTVYPDYIEIDVRKGDNIQWSGMSVSLGEGAYTILEDLVWVDGPTIVGYWTSTPSPMTLSVTYTLRFLDADTGYKVYQDGDVIATGLGPSFSFTATGGGEFEVVVWNTKQVSSMIVLTVNMVGLGILVSVIAGWVIPFSRSIKAGTYRTVEPMMKDLLKGVVFIVVALIMWGMLHSIAIG